MAVLLRRLAAVCVTALILPPTALAAGSVHSWAQPEIKLVTRQGIFAGTPATFHADDPLTQGALAAALAKLTATEPVTPTDTDAPVSLEQLDRSLVDALGLRDSAYLFYHAASAAGISAPRRFRSEVVARLLGLRLNHPAGQDDLELQPQQPATRAEAAYSLAQILRFDLEPDMWPVDEVKEAAAAFQLPALTPWQRRILTTAFSCVGYPYVWGGTGEGSAGFDCSGFVWRVYELTTYPEEGGLAGVLRGRTTMELSAEVPRAQRIPAAGLEPGDVMFFGRGPRSKAAQIAHAGIYLGNGWLVQSSGYGVALVSFEGWYRSSFAWARRPLAEAGLG